MPEVQSITVQARIDNHNTGIHVGDVVRIDGIVGKVIGATEGRDYLNVNHEPTDSKHVTRIRRLPLYDEVEVLREVPTEGEKLAGQIRELVKWAEKKTLDVTPHLDQMFTKMVTNYAKRHSAAAYFPLSLDDALDVIVLQQNGSLWRSVEDLRDERVEKGDSFDLATLRALHAVQESCVRDLTHSHDNPLSRSTSVSSNLEKDIARQAKANFIDGLRYRGDLELMIGFLSNVDN